MRRAGVEPNHITFVTIFSGCAHFPAKGVLFGPPLHAYAWKLGLDTNTVMVGTAVIDMYAKCGGVDFSRLVFDGLDMKNSMSWNTMMDGYMKNGKVDNAVELFEQMPPRGAVSWMVLIGGFVKKGQFEQALEWFREMQLSGVEPGYVTIIAVIAACADLGTLGLGLWINRFLVKQNFRDNIRIKEPHAEGRVQGRGAQLHWSFYACSQAGLVNEGLHYFDNMKRIHRITLRIEHYGCIVDLYSRAGMLEDVLNVIKNMPMKPNEVGAGSLLAACRTNGNISLAERLMKYLYELDPGVDSNYVLLSNTYAADGRWDGASKVSKNMKALGIQKMPGFSSVDID
ncbi:unnamed protein product [Prunus armeniaca]|uniref:Pentatricopeptide repeat-containing protein n=1 Tax=Prunus armeniaca TaxID=36596 RepID=A0A6J5XYR4_PRUAR|nr:unnamed protein product [Prunus armeniaca]